jgi:hypothetical protein
MRLNLTSHPKVKKRIEGVWKQNAEEKRKCVYDNKIY